MYRVRIGYESAEPQVPDRQEGYLRILLLTFPSFPRGNIVEGSSMDEETPHQGPSLPLACLEYTSMSFVG